MKDIKKIKVNNCNDCPLFYVDTHEGAMICYIDRLLEIANSATLPAKCPLRKHNYSIELNQIHR